MNIDSMLMFFFCAELYISRNLIASCTLGWFLIVWLSVIAFFK